MSPSRTIAPTRRAVLLGALSAPLAVGVLASASAAPARASKPECLADLIESGEVTRADLVAR